MLKDARIGTAALVAAGLSLSLAGHVWGQTYTTVVDSGASSNRVDLIFVGDGYTRSQIETTYATHVDRYVSYLFDTGIDSYFFGRYANYFNVHRVNVVSNQSGADIPQQNVYVDTALDARYNIVSGTDDRLLTVTQWKANAAVNDALGGSGIDNDMRIATVNSTKYGGAGGGWAVYSGGNSSALEIASHEVGHSFAQLADEYTYPNDVYTGAEPSEVNVTTGSDKWDRWLGYDDPNTDIGPIGYYEGGKYHTDDIYRPSDNSKMRNLRRAFDAISRERFIQRFYDEVDPLDAWMDTGITYTDIDAFWVTPVDENVIEVDWYLNGSLIGAGIGSTLELADLDLGLGDYEIKAVAYDGILDHAFTGDALDWYRLDPSHLTQTLSWNLTIASVPEPASVMVLGIGGMALLGRRRRRGCGACFTEALRH